MADKREIPYCPLMSAGNDVDRVCAEERCAWYVSSTKKCSAYIIAYNALLDANEKQAKKKG